MCFFTGKTLLQNILHNEIMEPFSVNFKYLSVVDETVSKTDHFDVSFLKISKPK